MEAVVYRKKPTRQQLGCAAYSAAAEYGSTCVVPAAVARGTEPLSPELPYPLVTEQEMGMWTHWLPSCFLFRGGAYVSWKALHNRLTQFGAPPEVVEECRWAWERDLFESYEIRTPQRRDLRDPLVLGWIGAQRSRIALWGESLLSLEEISALVAESLVIKKSATRWQMISKFGGALLGSVLGLVLAADAPLVGQQFVAALTATILGASIGAFPYHIFTPENRQHLFLDSYRR